MRNIRSSEDASSKMFANDLEPGLVTAADFLGAGKECMHPFPKRLKGESCVGDVPDTALASPQAALLSIVCYQALKGAQQFYISMCF